LTTIFLFPQRSRPLAILTQLRKRIYLEFIEERLPSSVHYLIEADMKEMDGVLASCERLFSSPIPPNMARHGEQIFDLYMYMCICVDIYPLLYPYLRILPDMVRRYTCVYLYLSVCMSIFIHIYIYICVCVCVCVCVGFSIHYLIEADMKEMDGVLASCERLFRRPYLRILRDTVIIYRCIYNLMCRRRFMYIYMYM